jgi:aminopeptidase N
MEGEDAYEKIFQRSMPRLRNDKPIVLGKDITEDAAYHPDIYPKGAFFMHTLRYVLGDSIFFPALLKVATDSNHTYVHTTNTLAVEQVFEQASGKALSPLFHLYLYTTDKLEINVRPVDGTHYRVQLLNIEMPLPLDITTSAGISQVIVDKKGITVTSSSMPMIDTRDFYLKKVIYDL